MAIANCGQGAPDTREFYSFTLILAGIEDITSDIENKLFDAGCDDATLGLHAGTPYLAFDREADSLADAINSAIKNVHDAGIGVEVIRVVPAGEETISLINALLKLRRELAHRLPKELAHRIDEIVEAIGSENPETALRGLLPSK